MRSISLSETIGFPEIGRLACRSASSKRTLAARHVGYRGHGAKKEPNDNDNHAQASPFLNPLYRSPPRLQQAKKWLLFAVWSPRMRVKRGSNESLSELNEQRLVSYRISFQNALLATRTSYVDSMSVSINEPARILCQNTMVGRDRASSDVRASRRG